MPKNRRAFLVDAATLLGAAAVGGLLPDRQVWAAGQSALTDLSAVDAVAAMRNGDLKAEDYARALLDRAASASKPECLSHSGSRDGAGGRTRR